MAQRSPVAPMLYTVAGVFGCIAAVLFLASAGTAVGTKVMAVAAAVCMVIGAVWAWGRYAAPDEPKG